MSAPGPFANCRTWMDPLTRMRYRVYICPRERTGALGVDRRLNAIVF